MRAGSTVPYRRLPESKSHRLCALKHRPGHDHFINNQFSSGGRSTDLLRPFDSGVWHEPSNTRVMWVSASRGSSYRQCPYDLRITKARPEECLGFGLETAGDLTIVPGASAFTSALASRAWTLGCSIDPCGGSLEARLRLAWQAVDDMVAITAIRMSLRI
jgi:hypothetical protein